MNWSGGVEWEISNNLLLEAIYQGSGAVGLLNNWDINAVPLNIALDYNTLDNIRRNVQNFKPYPQFGSIQLYSNFAHNTYHSGTVRMERRYRQGLFVNGFYTWSKILTDADAAGGISGVTYYNRGLEKARANYDISHRFVGTFILRIAVWQGPALGQSWRRERLGSWWLGFDVLADDPERTSDHCHVCGRSRQCICAGTALRVASNATASEPDPAQRSGRDAELGYRS
jgi:hypothetical protein